MTITIVCDILGEENNGTTIACMNLIRFLRAQGHTVRVVCADQDKAGNECFYVVPELNLYLLNPIVERNGVTLPSRWKRRRRRSAAAGARSIRSPFSNCCARSAARRPMKCASLPVHREVQ